MLPGLSWNALALARRNMFEEVCWNVTHMYIKGLCTYHIHGFILVSSYMDVVNCDMECGMYVVCSSSQFDVCL